MKIGIYTFFRLSYGAILQAFALQRVIKALSPDSEVLMVDFKTEHHKRVGRIFYKRSNNPFFNFIWQIHTLLRYRQLRKKRDSFKEFKTRFDYTDCYSSQSELLNNPPSLDIHLTGSDQVFNPRRNYRDVYYLNFRKGNSKKIAYAPSFGINRFSDDDIEYIRKTLSDFDVLSCRESDGAQLMSTLFGRNIPQVLDPVFLIPADEWRFLEIKPKIKRNYIFVYSLKNTNRLLQYARNKYPDSKLVLLSPNDLRFYPGCKHLYSPGPCDFIGLIDNAEAIVTDSFHGTAFSILFEKDFDVVITRPEVSSRIVSLLSLLGLQDHIASDDVISNNTRKTFKTELDRLISDSKQYLNSSLHCDLQ